MTHRSIAELRTRHFDQVVPSRAPLPRQSGQVWQGRGSWTEGLREPCKSTWNPKRPLRMLFRLNVHLREMIPKRAGLATHTF